MLQTKWEIRHFAQCQHCAQWPGIVHKCLLCGVWLKRCEYGVWIFGPNRWKTWYCNRPSPRTDMWCCLQCGLDVRTCNFRGKHILHGSKSIDVALLTLPGPSTLTRLAWFLLWTRCIKSRHCAQCLGKMSQRTRPRQCAQCIVIVHNAWFTYLTCNMLQAKWKTRYCAQCLGKVR